MQNVHPLIASIRVNASPAVERDAQTGLPVVPFNSKWRETSPCLVERDGMKFIHDPEVARRTNKFFGVGL